MDRSAFFGKTIFAVGMFAMLPWALRAQEPAIEGAGLVRPAANVSAFRMDSESLLRVEFSGRKTWGHVERGAVPEGRLSLPLYAGEHIIAPEGSAIRVTVNSAEKIRRNTGFWRKTGRVIVRAFNPLETNRPAEYCVELSAADLLLSTGEVLPLDARVLREFCSNGAAEGQSIAGNWRGTKEKRVPRDAPPGARSASAGICSG